MHWLQSSPLAPKPPLVPMFGSALSADETIRKSSSLPAYARHGFSFGLGRLRRNKKNKENQRRSNSSSSSSSSSSEIDDATVHAPSPKGGMGWERTKREEGRVSRPLSFETKVLVQETVFDSPNVRNASAKTTAIERTQPPARRWKETSGMSKKERREQLKARVEALRERLRDSSSDDDTPTGSSNSSLNSSSVKGPRLHKVHSDDALHRPRIPRTERGNARRKSQANSDLYVNTTPTVPRRYIHAPASEISIGNGSHQMPPRQWNAPGNSIKKEAPSNKSQSLTSVTNGCYHHTEKRPSSPYPCITTPPVVKSTPRAPTPPPRSPKTLTPFFPNESNGPSILPPPLPMRHSHNHPRPASYSFENTHPFITKGPVRTRESFQSTSPSVDQEASSGIYSYTDENSSVVNYSRATSSSYLSDSHASSLHRSATDIRNFNSTPKPWSPKGPPPIIDKPPSSKPNNLRPTTNTNSTPPIPPRRCSLHILPGSSSNDANKSPNNLEDALQELERIYQSLKLKDEGLLDRAERRELITSPYVNGVASKIKTSSELHLDKKEIKPKEEKPLYNRPSNDVSNLNKLNKLNVSGSYDSLVSDLYKKNRGPKLSDDLAFRRLQRPSSGRPATGTLMGSSTPTASYLLLSPALSPAVSADDVTKSGKGTSLGSMPFGRMGHQPDTVRDDVLFRSIRDANGQRPSEPQPPFGIPVGVVTPAPASDYLHAPEIGKPAKTRPTFQPRIYPDILQDDMAFRALRKDRSPPPSTRTTVGMATVTTTTTTTTTATANYKNTTINDNSWINNLKTDTLDNLIRTDCKPPTVGGAGKKKYRAVRSLSANITHLMMRRNPNLQFPTDVMDRTQSMSDLCQVLSSIVNDGDDNCPPMSATVSNGLSKIRTSSSSLLSITGHGGGNDFSTSTETLTESPSKEPGGEIWQVRVTLQPAAADDDSPPTITSSVVSPVATTFSSTLKTSGTSGSNSITSCSRAIVTTTPSRTIRSDDEAFPVWRRGTQPLDQTSRAYRPSQNFRPSRHSHLFGSVTSSAQKPSIPMASGSVSDTDMRRRGSPMDEGRLDELLRSLTQGTSNLSSQESHDDEPEVVPSQVRKNFHSKLENSSSTPVDGRLKSSLQSSAQNTSIHAQHKATPSNQSTYSRKTTPTEKQESSSVSGSSRPVGNTSWKDEFKGPPTIFRKISSSTTDSRDNGENGENKKKAERMAKYKEERRKQLASKYADWSSSEDITNIGEEPSYMRFSRRYKNAKNKEATTSESSGVEISANVELNGEAESSASNDQLISSNHNVPQKSPKHTGIKDSCEQVSASSPNHRVPDPGGTEFDKIVRTNRASRLRALATSGNHENVSANGEFIRTGSLRLRGSCSDADSCLLRSSPTRRSFTAHSSSTIVNGSAGNKITQVSTSSDATTDTSNHLEGGDNKTQEVLQQHRTKDKSSKRKSNLNRAMIIEAPSQPSTVLDDYSPKHSRLKQRIDGLEKRSQEIPIPQSFDGPSLNSPSRNSQVKEEYNQAEGAHKQEESVTLNKRSKSSPLKRPEIPEILRHRSYQTSSGLQKHQFRSVNGEVNEANYGLDYSIKPSDPSAFAVRIEVKGEDVEAANKIRELTELVRETTAKVDTLTNAALHSDSDMGAKQDKPVHSQTVHVIVSESENSSHSWDSQNITTLPSPSFSSQASISCPSQLDKPDHSEGIETQEKINSSHSCSSDSESNHAQTKVFNAVKVKACHSKIFRPEKYRAESENKVIKSHLNRNEDPQSIQLFKELRKKAELIKREQMQFQTTDEGIINFQDEDIDLSLVEKKSQKEIPHQEQTDSDDDAYLTPATDLGEKHLSSSSSQSPDITMASHTNKESLIISVNGSVSHIQVPHETKNISTENKPMSILKKKFPESQEKSIKVSVKGVECKDPPSILRKCSIDETTNTQSHYRDGSDDSDYRSHSPTPVSILRKRSSSDEGDNKMHSILKTKSTTFESDDHESSPEPHSILKRRYSCEDPESFSLEPRPILKKKSSLEDLEPKPILKKKSSTEEELEERLKPILKLRCKSGGDDFESGSSSSSCSSSNGGGGSNNGNNEILLIRRSSRSSSRDERLDSDIRPILKSRNLTEEDGKPTSILKNTSDASDNPSKPVSILRDRSVDTEENIPSILKVQKENNFENDSSETSLPSTKSENDSNSVPCTPLLPSILKKRSREIHPLATPHTEITNILKAHRTPEDDSSNKKITPIDIPEEGEDGPRVSVAERIFQMEARLEEEKFKVCASPWRSGQSTPRQRYRAGSTPPCRSGENTPLLNEKVPLISKENLISRLEDVVQSSRRSHRDRNSDRYRTQPITLDEVDESNNLASVQKFRRLVLTRASLDAFKLREKEQEPPSPVDKRTEFPQPFHPVKSKEWQKHRRRTLPVTLEELAEAEKAELKSSSQKFDHSSDENSSSGDDLIRMSVAAKASLFMQLEQGSVIKKSGFRRGLQRSQTQPVTFEELSEASKLADEDTNKTKTLVHTKVCHNTPLMKQSSMDTISKLVPNQAKTGSDKTSSESEDDPCKLSLSERVKLFNRKMIEERLPSQKPTIPQTGPSWKRKGNSFRYKTQPVTSEELEKAQTVKPSTSLSNLSETGTDNYDGIKNDTSSYNGSNKDQIDQSGESITCERIESSHIRISESNSSHTSVPESSKQINHISQGIQKTVLTKSIVNSSTVKESSFDAQIVTANSNNMEISGLTNGVEIKRIKNEAINRRRIAALRKQEDRRSACELYESSKAVSECSATPSNATESRRMYAVHHRSNTTPLTKLELEEAENSTQEGKQSIAERVAALQRSGEGWKKRVTSTKDTDLLDSSEDNNADSSSSTGNSESAGENRSSIVKRINRLQESKQGWKQRVEDKDAIQFTVAGKMGCSEEILESPEKSKRTPKAAIFRSKTADFRQIQKTETSLHPSSNSVTVKRSRSMPGPSMTVSESKDSAKGNTQPLKIAVPKADDESFQAFFESVSNEKSLMQKVEINEDVFQEVTSETRQMLVQKRRVKMQRRHVSSRNPIKMLATRSDIQNEYTEVKLGIAEKEFKRVKTEQIARNTSLAVSALAGLASKEDFTAVALKKSSSTSGTPLTPYKDLMLLQVKGRRHVQTRLVEPSISSINKGDNYILVSQNEVYNWIGEFSNVIERSRAAEVAGIIQSRKDLGCSSSTVITIDNEKKTGMSHASKYYKLLGGKEEQVKVAGNPKEDELYESAIINTNMAYEVEDDKLLPLEAYWGAIPKHEMLDAKKVLVFDFGSEMYVWQGKLAPTELRKAGITLARELWEKGYDYSDCDINPISPLLNDSVPKKGIQRPEWTLLAKLNQHMETVLFQEKFLDWPDTSRIIKVKRKDSDEKNEPNVELVPCDVKLMLESVAPEPDLILEGSHVGRGSIYWDQEEKRQYKISTLGIKVWHVSEYSHRMLPRESWGQFHSGETYVVRWQYRITVAGRNLAGQMSKHSLTGRERSAYFFWQGSNSTLNEKGASALMTVELDEERGPHVRVVQGNEPPCFLALFDGTMIVHRGKRQLESEKKDDSSADESSSDDKESGSEEEDDEDEETDKSSEDKPIWKLFLVRGILENEMYLTEIEPSTATLRSRGCIILINISTGVIYVWHGSKASSHLRPLAVTAAENIRHRKPFEIGFSPGVIITVEEVVEGSESSVFLQGLGNGNLQAYYSLKNSSQDWNFTPRLFHMTSVLGTFSANEIVCPFHSQELSCAFPFLQSDLYRAQQPALFLLDNNHEVYLWQGWWPEATDDSDNCATGSAKVRWNVDRRCAMETVINYCKGKNSKNVPPSYLVSAGLEPLKFINLFPEWEVREDVTILNEKDGRQPGEQPLVSDVLGRLTRTRYTLTELQNHPLPEGVDPSHLESYLDDQDFQDALQVTREDFYCQPAWKQTNLKKTAGLF